MNNIEYSLPERHSQMIVASLEDSARSCVCSVIGTPQRCTDCSLRLEIRGNILESEKIILRVFTPPFEHTNSKDGNSTEKAS